MENIKLSTSRDFRIKVDVVQERLQVSDDDDEEEQDGSREEERVSYTFIVHLISFSLFIV